MSGNEKYFRIEISSDELTAYCIRLDSGTMNLTLQDLKTALEKAGIKFGIDESALITALNATPGTRTVIATGNPPKPGCDAVINIKESPLKKSAPKLLPDGTVDYKDMQLVKNVVKGQIIAEKEPAMPGLPGMTVKRSPIYPPPVKDPPLPVGANTAVTSDGLKLVSLIDGHLVIESQGLGRQEIRIDETFVLKRSVDMATGNIYCIGNCEIRGNVLEGFKVIAQGNIKILGFVEGAEIISHGGNIEIIKGLKGQGKALIKALKEVKTKFVENAVIEAGENIRIEEHSMHSKLYSAGGIYIEGNPGAVIGGETAFVTWLKANQIGSDANPKTHIYLGNWIAREAIKEILEIQKMLAELRIQAETSQTALNQIRQLSLEDPEKYSEEIKSLEKLAAPLPRLQERIKELTDKMQELQKKAVPMETKPVINITGTLFAGVIFEGEEFEPVTIKNNRRSLKITVGEGQDGKIGLRVRQLRG